VTDLLRTTEDGALTLVREESDPPEAEFDPTAGRREVDIRVMPWNVVANTPEGRESFVRTAFDGVDPSSVVIESMRHDGSIVGAGMSYRAEADGGYLRTKISRTPAGDELLRLVHDKVLRRASVLFAPLDGGTVHRSDGVLERQHADLRRVAIVPRGAYPGAEVVAMRSEENTVPEPQPLTLDAIQAAVRTIVADAIPAPVINVPGVPAEPGVLARAESLNDAYTRVLAGDEELARAFADAVTGDVPEIVRPAWLTDIRGIMDRGRPTITSFGRASLPDSGMDINWPTFDGDFTGRVAEQVTQKSEIISKKLTLDSASAALKTYAGGVDISWQLIQRSSPSYRDAVIRIISIAYGIVTDGVMAAAVEAAAAAGPVVAAGPNAAAIAAALFEASGMVEDATGQPANFVLAGTNAWLDIASSQGLVPAPYGTQNVSGTADARSLQVNVSGLPIIRDRNLAPTTVLVSASITADWLEDGPRTAQQDVVAKLGTDVAVWGIGAPAIYIPTGIVKLTIA
jgi:HK97 family phage prohead protease